MTASQQSFLITAPGKVILFGEHAVVYGFPAIACSVGIKTKALVKHLDIPIVNLSFSTLNVYKNWNIKDLNCIKQENVNTLDLDERLLKRIEDYLSKETDSMFVYQSLAAFLYLWCCLSCIEKGLDIQVSSDLPIGGGLGSSASYSATLSLGLLLHFDYIKDSSHLSNQDYELINHWTFISEKIIHGNPSGLNFEM